METEVDTQGGPLTSLFRPGERLGWVFRDRHLFLRRFPEPAPHYPGPPPELDQREHSARASRSTGTKLVWILGGVGLAVFSCCSLLVVFGDSTKPSGSDASAVVFPALALMTLLTAGAGFGLAQFLYIHRTSTIKVKRFEHWRGFVDASAAWAARKEEFESQERARVDQMVEWGAATPPSGTHRIDIVGGNAWGWEALLTVYGGSLLHSRSPVLIVDLSGEAVCRELVRLAQAAATSVDLQVLPDELADSDLLVGLDTRQLGDVLVESMYGDAEAAVRADRAMDSRILSTACQALGETVSIARLTAALRVLMGEPGDTPELTDEERRRIADDLFSDEYRRQAHPHLRRIESHLHPLRALGSRPAALPAARLTCVAMATDGHNARNELLNDLIVQWLTRRMVADTEPVRTLVIAGADELACRHVERLSEICERRGIRLVWMFRHLRGAAVQALGGRTVAFMRLANHEEARQAADFIGRQHKFTITQVTRSLGGNETHSVGDTTGGSETTGHSIGGNKSRTKSSSGTFFGPEVSGDARGVGTSWSSNFSVSRNWSQTRSVAEGTNWSDASSHQRVYEYTVEPRTLQDLPDYAMLLVTWRPGGSMVQPVECNPDIVTLPRMSFDPLPDIPLPGPDAAAGAGGWPAAPNPLAGMPQPPRGGW